MKSTIGILLLFVVLAMVQLSTAKPQYPYNYYPYPNQIGGFNNFGGGGWYNNGFPNRRIYGNGCG
ncbi:hypothetical protein Bhyg_16341, partial [Pseudolycoriella hygida]